jgi:hypothetical protein
MSHQEAKAEAEQIIRDLLGKHSPGYVFMVLQKLKKILRATKDLTIYAEKPLATPPQKGTRLENAGDKLGESHPVKSVANRVAK